MFFDVFSNYLFIFLDKRRYQSETRGTTKSALRRRIKIATCTNCCWTFGEY